MTKSRRLVISNHKQNKGSACKADPKVLVKFAAISGL